MSDQDSNSSLSELIQNLDLSQFSASLMQNDSFDQSSSIGFNSVIANSPENANFKPFPSSSGSSKSEKKQFRQRDNLIESMRIQYRQQIETYQNKLAKALETIEQKKIEFKDKISKMNTQKDEEIEEINKRLGSEIKKLKSLNRSRKENLTFANLPIVTESNYMQIKSVVQNEISIPEFVALQLYERDNLFRKQIAEINSAKNEVLSKLESKCQELMSISHHLENEKIMREALEAKLASLSKGNTFIASVPIEKTEKIKKLEAENSELRSSCQVSITRYNDISIERDSLQKKLYKQEVEMNKLISDNATLKAQIGTISELANKQETFIQDYRMEIAELKRIRDEFFNKSIVSSEQRKNDIGSMLQAEVSKIAERSRIDIDYIRELSEKMRTHEVQVLTNSYNQALEEVKTLRSDLRKSEEERTKLQAEYQTLQLAHETEINRISSDLRVKSYELERIRLSNDELKSITEDLTDDRDALSAKFDIVKQELMKMESEIKIKNSQIITLQEKVSLYEKLETELDSAIENLDLRAATPLALPSDANRRVKQSILLSKRVMQLTSENQSLKNELEKTQNELSASNKQIDELKTSISNSSQPQQVFISLLSEKQNEINKLKKKVSETSELNNGLKKEKDSIMNDIHIFSEKKSQIKKIGARVFDDEDDMPTNDHGDPAPFIISRNGY